jgi:N-acetylneuraminic acid mutarotase
VIAMQIKVLAFLTLGMTASGCFKMPLASMGKLDSPGIAQGITQAASKSVAEGKEIATFDPDSKSDVQLTMPKVQGLTGARVVVAPGSLGIAVDLVVELASEFGETSMSGEIGLADDIQVAAASPGLIIRPTENVDLKRPLSLAMPLPAGLGLRLQGGSKYGVFYKYFDPDQQKLVTGLKIFDGKVVKMILDEVTQKDVLSFEGYFGVYWAVILSREVADSEVPPPKPAEEPIINKAKVAVIQNSGAVKEAEVVQKQAIAELVWPRPSMVFNADTRMVAVSVKPPEGQRVDACKIDLFESVFAQKGISLESPLGTQVEYMIANPKEHALVARFRCSDAQARITITPWSEPLIIPALQAASIAQNAPSAADDLCSDSVNNLTVLVQNEQGQYVPMRSIPKVGKCRYATKIFQDSAANFFIQTPAFDLVCGKATHVLDLSTQTISCDKPVAGSLGSNFMSLPPGNLTVEVDFSGSRTSPKVSIAMIPCAMDDMYVLSGYPLDASQVPTAADKMVHKGACEFERTSTAPSLFPSGYITFRNLSGTFSCGSSSYSLDAGGYYENICGTGAFRKFSVPMTPVVANSHRVRLRLGESAASRVGNPNIQSTVLYTIESRCPERLFIASTFHGASPIEGRNILYRKGACTYSYPFYADASDPSVYDFQIKSLDGSRVCGGVNNGTSITLDCSNGAPAIAFGANATDKSYRLSIWGDAVTGTLNGVHLNQEPTYCPSFYLHPNALLGYSNSVVQAMDQVKGCYFEKLWTPVAGNVGFNLTSGNNQILSPSFNNGAQPTLNGSFVGLNWTDAPANALKTLPVGIAPNSVYRVILDARWNGNPKVKIESFNPASYGCPDDLHLLADLLVDSSPSAGNKFTYNGACNYAFTLRNSASDPVTLSYRIANATNTVQCALGSGSDPSPDYTNASSALACSSSVDPYVLTVPGRTAFRFFVKRASGGNPERLTLVSLAPPVFDIELAGQAAESLSPSARRFHDPVSFYQWTAEKSFISQATTPISFHLKSTTSNYFCAPTVLGSAALNTPIPMNCGYAQAAPANTFGPYAAGALRLHYLPPADIESPPHLLVTPYVQVSDFVRLAPKFSSPSVSASPSYVPNGTSTTNPGGVLQPQTWTAPNGDLYLFGGRFADYSMANSLWRYTPSSGVWMLVNGTDAANQPSAISPTPRPGARYGSAGFVDATMGRLYLFGGTGLDVNGAAGSLNDLWYYEISSNTWSFVKGSITVGPLQSYPGVGSLGISNASFAPPARHWASAFVDGSGSFWLYGGIDQNSTVFGDLWRFTPTGSSGSLAGDWAWMGGPQGGSPYTSGDPFPANRHSSASWVVGNTAYVFGGYGPILGNTNDLWSLNLSNGTWTLRQSNAPNDVRFWENLSFHPSNRPAPMYGLRPITWVQGSDRLWLSSNGAFYAYRPSLNQWAVASPGEVAIDVSGNPIDPIIQTTSFDANNDFGRRSDGATWSGPSGFFLFGGYTSSVASPWNDLWRIEFP